jgi:hypothetical protein
MLVLAALISRGYFGFTDWAYAAEAVRKSQSQERRPHHFALTSFLADQQNKSSGSYQQSKQTTDS